MDEPILFCPHEATTLDAKDTRWPADAVARGLGWTLTGDLPGFTHATMLDTLRRAFVRISEVCGLKFFEASGNANIIVGTGPIDGPSGVLAWSNLPPADPCEQKYDASERWNQTVNLLPVMLHELGHALGLQHDPNAGALLSAYYSPQIQDYTSRDIARLQALYGPPTTTPIPPTPPLPPTNGGNDTLITVRIVNANAIQITDALTGKPYRVLPPV